MLSGEGSRFDSGFLHSITHLTMSSSFAPQPDMARSLCDLDRVFDRNREFLESDVFESHGSVRRKTLLSAKEAFKMRLAVTVLMGDTMLMPGKYWVNWKKRWCWNLSSFILQRLQSIRPRDSAYRHPTEPYFFASMFVHLVLRLCAAAFGFLSLVKTPFLLPSTRLMPIEVWKSAKFHTCSPAMAGIRSNTR